MYMDTSNLTPLRDIPAILKVSKATLWSYMKAGKISVVRYSERKVFIRQEELERFIWDSEK